MGKALRGAVLSGARILMLAMVPLAANAQAAWTSPCASKQVLRPTGAQQPRPALPNQAGCTRGYRIEARPGLAFWRCDDDGAGTMNLDNAAASAILVEQDGRIVQSFADEAQGGGLDTWMVVGADLDGSGQRSWTIAAWNSQSQGMGINTWSLHVVDPGGRHAGSLPDIADWSPDLIVRASGAARGCTLATSRFTDGASGAMTWIVGFKRLVGGRLAAEPGRATLQRRYDRAFERERTAWFSRPGFNPQGNPIAWLAPATPVRP
jgi:hypothetical protein